MGFGPPPSPSVSLKVALFCGIYADMSDMCHILMMYS